MTLVVILVVALVAAPALEVHTPDGRAAVLPRPGVVMFWRSDCAPCRIELENLAAVRRAAAPLRVQLLDLDPAPSPGRARDPEGLRTNEDAARVLVAWGGAPPRLPLAVAVDARGRLCARHTGLIGYDRLKAWARACGGAVARR